MKNKGIYLVILSFLLLECKNEVYKLPDPELGFNTMLTYGTMTDYDGNVYQTIKIGNQTWMAENLRVTHFNNGRPIEHIMSDSIWGLSWYYGGAVAYCVYGNHEGNRKRYGLLYTNKVVGENAPANVAPPGWHVPSNEEWITLFNHLGADSVVGGQLKEAGFVHWQAPNVGATNSSGFTALPGGLRSPQGVFVGLGTRGIWWSSTNRIIKYHPGKGVSLSYDTNAAICERDSFIEYGYAQNTGLSVRLVKD